MLDGPLGFTTTLALETYPEGRVSPQESRNDTKGSRLGFTIGTSNHNLEIHTVLAAVGSARLVNWSAPPGTLDVGRACGVGAAFGGVGVQRWVSLEECVEGNTILHGVTDHRALGHVVA